MIEEPILILFIWFSISESSVNSQLTIFNQGCLVDSTTLYSIFNKLVYWNRETHWPINLLLFAISTLLLWAPLSTRNTVHLDCNPGLKFTGWLYNNVTVRSKSCRVYLEAECKGHYRVQIRTDLSNPLYRSFSIWRKDISNLPSIHS